MVFHFALFASHNSHDFSGTFNLVQLFFDNLTKFPVINVFEDKDGFDYFARLFIDEETAILVVAAQSAAVAIDVDGALNDG